MATTKKSSKSSGSKNVKVGDLKPSKDAKGGVRTGIRPQVNKGGPQLNKGRGPSLS